MVDKLASIKRSTTSGPRFKFGLEVDQHLKILQSFKPQKFRGASDLIMVKDWLLKIEKSLDGMICIKNRRVIMTTCILEGEDERLWQA